MPPSLRADRLSNIPTSTVWHEMTSLANECKAVNLGQGFPSIMPPSFLLKKAQHILSECATTFLHHQYTRSQGNPELVEEIRLMYAARFLRTDLTNDNILITNGATQGLHLVFQALINPGDEVVIFEPFYDAYRHDIELAGGVVKYVQLIPDSKGLANAWSFSKEQLLAEITPKTKAILVNTPQNVPGKAWSQDEVELVVRVAEDRNLLVIVDEVYMSLVYESAHISLATLPGMWERTITLSSIGKTFSCTGWKIGWAVGPSELIGFLTQVASYQTFSVSTPLQIAVAHALQEAKSTDYYKTLVEGYMQRRKLLCDALSINGLTPVVPSGGFFVLADISRVDPRHYYNPDDTEFARDWQFCRWLTRTIGVCAIPTTAFCSQPSRLLYDRYARFAFCKTEGDIRTASERLAKLKDYFIDAGDEQVQEHL